LAFRLHKRRIDLHRANIQQELSRSLQKTALAENALAESYQENERLKTRFALMRQATSDGLWDMETNQSNQTDANNPFWWSDQFRRLLGFCDEKGFPNVLGSWASRLHPEDSAPTLAAFTAHINDRSGRTPYDVTYRLRCRNGEYRWFSAHGKTMRASDGTALRVAGSLSDITVPNAILDLKRYAEDIIANLPAGLIVADDAKRVLSINRSVREIFGLKSGDDVSGCETEANAFDQSKRNLLEEMPMVISFALDNFVREAARKQAEVALRESEARYRIVRCKHDAGDTIDINTCIAADRHVAEQTLSLTDDRVAEKRSDKSGCTFELGGHQAIRLLLVEDSDHDTEIITCRLCKGGINFQLRRVETEASFRQALQDPVDLVIFSFLIPEFSAVCALEILEAHRPSNIPLIILSGAVGAEAAVGAMKRGAMEYVAKESIGTLPDAVKRVLEVAGIHENQRMTQEKLANANVHLAKLSIQLIEIQEQERKNLAREMHDELGQRLTLLKISLHRMREFLSEPRALNTWETMDAEVTVLAAQIRTMSGSLRPQTLDYVGLESAVRQLLESSFSNTRISYIFEYAGLPSKIAAPIDITAYRIVQESVTNIVKHANATQVVVEINGGETGDEMEIVVRDNGIGFDTARIKTMQLDSVSSGLLGLRERIDLLGGSITVDTSIGKGTQLVVSVPLKGVINGKN
jgi:PAS domain S-box-containing protein